MFNKKGQAAMEFLMTYGWAILVVLAAIGALAYFGVLSPQNFLPDSCQMAGGFNLPDCKADTTAQALRISFQNNLGADVTGFQATFSVTQGSAITACTPNILPQAAIAVANGQVVGPYSFCTGEMGGANPPTSGRIKGTLSVAYTKVGETLSHAASGDVNIKLEA